MVPYRASDQKRVVVRHLSCADYFNRLAKRCPPTCRAAFYRLKNQAIDRAVCHSPGDFQVDSIIYGPEPIVGVTHLPSGRRFHARPYRQAPATQAILHRLAAAVDRPYPFLRPAACPQTGQAQHGALACQSGETL